MISSDRVLRIHIQMALFSIFLEYKFNRTVIFIIASKIFLTKNAIQYQKVSKYELNNDIRLRQSILNFYLLKGLWITQETCSFVKKKQQQI